jgi:hypothetical protein
MNSRPKPKIFWPSFIAGLILFLTYFFPWLITTSSSFMSGTMTLTYKGGADWGFLSVVMGFAAAILSIAPHKIRAIGTIVAAIVAITGIVLFWTHIPKASVQYGIIVAIIASVSLLIIGIVDYFRDRQQHKSSVIPPPKTTPPTQS